MFPTRFIAETNTMCTWAPTIPIWAHTIRETLVISPILARTFVQAGWSKSDVQHALFYRARIPASTFEKMIGE